MSVLAIAIVNSENIPVVIKTKHSESDPSTISSLFHLHSSLDIIEEKRNLRDCFLGVLTQSESFKIYGFASTTNIKILLMVSNQTLRDNEARGMLKTLHNAYIDSTAGNPFYTYGNAIKSKTLQSVIDNIFLN